MSYGSGDGRAEGWGSCGYARRRKRRRQRADDLMSQLGLTGAFYWDDDDGMGDGTGAQSGEGGKAQARIVELEKTVETMSETITALSERVKVLERIVVDDEANIAREIDKLKGGDAKD